MTFTKRIFLFLAIVLTSHTYAQTISMDQVPMEDALRRLQLMGKIEGDISFMLRPIQSTRLHSWDTVLQSIDPRVKAMGNQKIDKHFLGKWGYASLLPVQITQQYVTAQPFQELDGPMIASSGYQVMASAGIFAKLGPLTIQLQPQYVSAANSDFRGTKQTPNYQQTHWGNSSIRLNAGPVSVGISNENITWGPSLTNPLLMSAHAPGFFHYTINSRRPLRTPIGSFEWQWVAGYLNGAEGSLRPIIDYPYAANPVRRYFNAAMIAYKPKWLSGLSIGATRTVQELETLLNDNKQWDLLFRNISRSSDKEDFVNSLLYSVEDNRDQYGAVFIRWVILKEQAEFYSEWGRNDAFFNLRDFIQDPEHSRGYTFGLRKLFNKNKTNKYWQFNSEYTTNEQPSSYPVRSAGSWYGHTAVFPGYTNYGDFLGAPMGQSARSLIVNLSKFNGWNKIGFQFERNTHNAEFYDLYKDYSKPNLTKWVDFGFRLYYDRPYKKIYISSTFAIKRSFNYKWSQPGDATGVGFNNPNDLNSFLFKLIFRYL